VYFAKIALLKQQRERENKMTKTTHHFPNKFSELDLNKLVDNVTTLNKWMSRVNSMADLLDPIVHNPNKFKGDAFEHLIEVLIINSPVDKRINLKEYSPTEIDAAGIDGIGKAHDGSVHIVQMKYHSDVTHLLDNSHDNIAMFPAVQNVHNAKYMTIFTTAKDLHYTLQESFGNQIIVRGYSDLKNLLNDNDAFWELYAESLMNS